MAHSSGPRSRLALCCTLLLCCCLLANAAPPKKPRTLIVMGDSMSDNGNAFRVSNNTLPDPKQGYYKGRFSDGPVWSDYVVQGTNVSVFNVAYPGATACVPYTPNYGLPFFVPYLSQQYDIVAAQIDSFSTRRSVFLYMGLNDVATLAFFTLLGQLNSTTALAGVDSISTCIATTAERLVRRGITSSLIISTIQSSNILPFWHLAFKQFGVPPAAQKQLLTLFGELSRNLNAATRSLVATLAQKYPNDTIELFDMYDVYHSILYDGPDIGLPNTTNACEVVDGILNAAGDPKNNVTSLCADPSSYVFWDHSHPTTATHKFLAGRIKDSLKANSYLF